MAANNTTKQAVCGRYCAPNKQTDRKLLSYLDEQIANKFQFVCYALGGTDRYEHKADSEQEVPPISLVSTQLQVDAWSQYVMGCTSPWIDLDHPTQSVRDKSTRALDHELDYAKYIGLRSVLITCHSLCANVNREGVSALANYLRGRLWSSHAGNLQYMVIVNTAAHAQTQGDCPVWMQWRHFRTRVRNHKSLFVCLRLTADLGDEFCSAETSAHWKGEPIGAVLVPAQVMNSTERTLTLPPTHRQLLTLTQATLPTPQVILDCTVSDVNNWVIQEFSVEASRCVRLSAETHAQMLHRATQTMDMFNGYDDYLQIPLQPLSDNLDANTYATFERDPVKYARYQDATEQALLDLVVRRREETGTDRVTVVVMVLGAGRGPLVATSLAAYEQVQRRVKGFFDMQLYAVEKNDYAYLTIQQRNQHEWNNKVHVVHSDMRSVKVPVKADLIISELLGSFGDNELSPECLDGALHLCKADTISIPQSYTSFVNVLHSVKLYNAITELQGSAWHANNGGRFIQPAGLARHRAIGDSDSSNVTGGSETAAVMLDMPYIVHLTSCHLWTHAPCQPMFTFKHPNFARPDDNERDNIIEFTAAHDTEMSGFVGYFSTDLYLGKYSLSIEPSTFSEGMFSWFPTVFMLRSAVLLTKGDTVKLWMARKTDATGVWYEWRLLAPVETPIQNENGVSYYMRKVIED